MSKKNKPLSQAEIERRNIVKMKSARDEKIMRDMGTFNSIGNGHSHCAVMIERR
jgi:hypothetical protein